MKLSRARFTAAGLSALSLILAGPLSPNPLAAMADEQRTYACRSVADVIEELRELGYVE